MPVSASSAVLPVFGVSPTLSSKVSACERVCVGDFLQTPKVSRRFSGVHHKQPVEQIIPFGTLRNHVSLKGGGGGGGGGGTIIKT